MERQTETNGQTDRQTHTHTHRQTNWSKNITPPRFRGGVKKKNIHKTADSYNSCKILNYDIFQSYYQNNSKNSYINKSMRGVKIR